jgi:hypothetical protein
MESMSSHWPKEIEDVMLNLLKLGMGMPEPQSLAELKDRASQVKCALDALPMDIVPAHCKDKLYTYKLVSDGGSGVVGGCLVLSRIQTSCLLLFQCEELCVGVEDREHLFDGCKP